MEEHEMIELRSEDVQEILGAPPNWLVRWGTALIVLLVVLMGWLSYFIKYPDVITAPVVVTTSQPPTSIIARADGILSKIYVSEKDQVKTGATLALIQSTARYDDIIKVEQLLVEFQNSKTEKYKDINPGKNRQLGELQSEYNAFVQALEIFTFSASNQYEKVNANQLKNQISKLQKDLSLISKKINATKYEKLNQAEQFSAKQRTLYAQGVVSRNDLESANSKIFEIKNELNSLESTFINKELEIGTLKAKILEINQGANLGNSDKTIKLKETAAALQAAIERWKQTYLITAPISGRVSFFNKFWKEQQFVKNGEELLSIVPDEQQNQQKIIGRVMMPVQGAGKVKEGQRVVILLASYPYEEFGTVEAKVGGISLIPKDNMYAIQLDFPAEKLTTNYKKEIPQTQQLIGDAQIITEEKRFIQRIFEKVRGISHKY
ncbi:MAG: HlyD family secretion protein [Saprospiraceae bacterium]